MSPREIFALRDYLDPGLKGRTLSDARHLASLTDIADQTCLNGRIAELSGRSVLLVVSSQFLAALVMLEIDGIARAPRNARNLRLHGRGGAHRRRA